MMPEGLAQFNSSGDRLCVKLKKSLYGLRQAPRIWNALLTQWLVDYGFKQSEFDPCLFVYSSNAIVILLLIWVDDYVIIDN